jgi:hypothetical protein
MKGESEDTEANNRNQHVIMKVTCLRGPMSKGVSK